MELIEGAVVVDNSLWLLKLLIRHINLPFLKSLVLVLHHLLLRHVLSIVILVRSALVAGLSKGEIVVEACLASPIFFLWFGWRDLRRIIILSLIIIGDLWSLIL